MIRKNDDQVDDYFADNNLKKMTSVNEITGWVGDLSDTQADWLIEAF